jgi:outer membrane lipoprotein-sorting protein
MKLFRTALRISGLLVMLAAAAAFAAPATIEIMTKMQDMQDQKSDVSAKVKITQQRTEQGVKVFESLFFRRDVNDSFLIINTAPESEKGNGYLKIGDNMWMYRQNTRTFQHINRDESISGTDMKAGDIEKRKFTELYSPVNNVPVQEMLGKIPVYRFELKAKVNDVTYPKQIYWVRTDNYLPLKVQNFSLSGTLMQTSYYITWTQIEGKYMMLKGLFIDEFEKGNKTIFEMSGISLSAIDNAIFTKGYLENVSK